VVVGVLGEVVADLRHLTLAGAAEGQGVEDQEDRFAASEVGQGDLLVVLVLEGEVRRLGSQEEFEEAVGYLKACQKIAEAEAEKNKHYGKMISWLNGYNVVDFPDAGYYSYKATKKGVNTLNVKIKNEQVQYR
jgi:hypothetical protein